MHRGTAGVAGVAIITVIVAGSCSQPGRGTVQGHVTAGPTCPVERIPPDPQCADRPVASTAVLASNQSGGYSTVTDADGYYRLVLPAGVAFTINVGLPGRFPVCPSDTVTVSAGRTVTKDIGCDTGIR